MTKDMKQWVKKTFPQKADRIIRKSLSEGRIQAAGIELKTHEIFVQYPACPDYYGSNYGRVISLKSGNLTLLTESLDSHGYVVYKLTKPRVKRGGKLIGDPKKIPVTGHRIVADLFLPNYWQEMQRGKLETHHLDRNRSNNKWTNLILVPGRLHHCLNKIQRIYFYSNQAFRKRTPYEIQRATDMSLEDIILPFKSEDYLLTEQDGHQIRVYDLGGYFVGFQPTEAAIIAERKKRARQAEKEAKKAAKQN